LNSFANLGLPDPGTLGNLTAPLVAAAVAGYLLGSVPFGYIVSRMHGVDIFEQGSKSSGATNVRRVVGVHAGNKVFALDLFKGAVAAAWPLYFRYRALSQGASPDALDGAVALGKLLGVVGLVAALIGHSYSVFIGFRGGKGVATATGGFLVLMPGALLVGAAVWAVTFFLTRYVSLASMLAVLALPVAAFLFGEARFLVIITWVVAAFVILRHRANIVRLIRGTENRFDRKNGRSA
jgi:glycerol-3-phosphate acyltransferase PlsY